MLVVFHVFAVTIAYYYLAQPTWSFIGSLEVLREVLAVLCVRCGGEVCDAGGCQEVADEWCLDDELLARMEAREDATLGYDVFNEDTFGDGACLGEDPDADLFSWGRPFDDHGQE